MNLCIDYSWWQNGALFSCSLFTSRGRTLQAASLTVSRAPVIGTIKMIVCLFDNDYDADCCGNVGICLYRWTLHISLSLSIFQSQDYPNREKGTTMYKWKWELCRISPSQPSRRSGRRSQMEGRRRRKTTWGKMLHFQNPHQFGTWFYKKFWAKHLQFRHHSLHTDQNHRKVLVTPGIYCHHG